MIEDTRRKALSEFLKAQRNKLQPQAVGLSFSGRRRTPGLRREEVALLAGVSTTWYTWLEQGRDISVSAHVLNCIANALQLNDDERNYLFVLANNQVEHKVLEKSTVDLDPSVLMITNELKYFPTIVSDRRCNVIGWNEAAAKVFVDFHLVPEQERNILWILFTRKEFKALAENWNDFIRGFVAIFRAYYGEFMGDPWYTEFLTKINEMNPEFETFWNQNEVNTAPNMRVEFRHAKAGKMFFDLTSLQTQGNHEIRMSVYTPARDSNTKEKIKSLLRAQSMAETPAPR